MNQIENYNISKSQYGVITLIINTRDRWLKYLHEIDPKGYLFKIDNDGFWETLLVHNSELNFDLENEGWYHELHLQEKDQIVYYFIPIRLLKGDIFAEKFIQSKFS